MSEERTKHIFYIAGKPPSFGGLKGRTNHKKITVVLDEEGSGHFDAFYGDDELKPDNVIYHHRKLAIPLAESLYAAFKAGFCPYDRNDPDVFYEEEASYWNVSEEWAMVMDDNNLENDKAFNGKTRRGKEIKPTVYDSSLMPTQDQLTEGKRMIGDEYLL